MRVMFISQYFLPQPLANAEVIGGLVNALARRGNELTVVSPVDDPPTVPGVRHRRAPASFAKDRSSIVARILEYGSFTISATAVACTESRPDVIVVPSPPLTLGLVGLVAGLRHRCPVVYNVQDLYPEIASAVGSTPGLLRRLMQFITRIVYMRSDLVVVIDPAFKDAITRSCPNSEVSAVRNGINLDPFEGAQRDNNFLRSLGVDPESMVVMYAGNVGRSQDFRALVSATELAGASLVVHGGGARLDDLRAKVRSSGAPHVHFSGYLPREQLGTLYASADLHVVPLKPSVAWASVPSKLLSIFAAGRPAVLAAEEGSPAATILDEADGGWRVNPGDERALQRAICDALAQPPLLRERGEHARTWASQFASDGRMADGWATILERTVRRSSKSSSRASR